MTKTVLNLGCGVQSSTLALMIKEGQLAPIDYAIFADTGAEPQHVYDYLSYLKSLLPFPIHIVKTGEGLKEHLIKSVQNGRFAGPPFFTESDKSAKGGMLRRQCTREFKIDPINQKIRELAGLKKGQRAPKGKILAHQIMGISMDEVIRMKPSREKWSEKIYPLIEMRMTRHDCLVWLKKHGYKIPNKSACTFCPYHDQATWREMKMNDPVSWAEAVKMDELIRNGTRGTKQKLYVHRSLTPLAEVDLRSEKDMGQLSLFGEDCEGMCGV